MIKIAGKSTEKSWIIIRKHRGTPKIKLFCFPYAGGGASVFREWPDLLPESIEVCAIQYPGRENRINETPVSRFETMVDELYNALLPAIDIPYAFFGHSMGAKLAFEVAKRLSLRAGKPPLCVFASGARAPHIPAHDPIHHCGDAEFVASLRRYEGTPGAVLHNEELMSVFLPMLRADFILDETYVSSEAETLSCPIYAFAGESDNIAPPEEVRQWGKFTRGLFQMDTLRGDHFFIKALQSEVVGSIGKRLSRLYG